MPSGDHVFKNAKEREAARLEREAEQARAQAAAAEQAKAAEEQRQREAFLATPVGAATAAKEVGQQFLRDPARGGPSRRERGVRHC
jgi:hypothetical protein